MGSVMLSPLALIYQSSSHQVSSPTGLDSLEDYGFQTIRCSGFSQLTQQVRIHGLPDRHILAVLAAETTEN